MVIPHLHPFEGGNDPTLMHLRSPLHQVLNLPGKLLMYLKRKKTRDELCQETEFILVHNCDGAVAVLLFLGCVGKAMGMEKAEALQHLRELRGKGKGDIPAHRMAYHQTFSDSESLQYRANHICHQLHGMDTIETFALSMSRKVDGYYPVLYRKSC